MPVTYYLALIIGFLGLAYSGWHGILLCRWTSRVLIPSWHDLQVRPLALHLERGRDHLDELRHLHLIRSLSSLRDKHGWWASQQRRFLSLDMSYQRHISYFLLAVFSAVIGLIMDGPIVSILLVAYVLGLIAFFSALLPFVAERQRQEHERKIKADAQRARFLRR